MNNNLMNTDNISSSQELLDIPIVKDRYSLSNIKPISEDEVEFRTLEYPSKFIITGYFKQLNIKSSQTIRKIEPILVSETQLKSSEKYLEEKENILRKLNNKLNEIRIILENRRK